MLPILGFTPDADPTTPGVVTDCSNMIPTERGLAGGPSPIVAVSGLAALAAECRGAAVLVDTAGTRRNFAGTQTKLYELSGSTWADRSRGGNYTGSTENRWLFVQFGNAALAVNDIDNCQVSTSGAFADITTAIKARLIVATKDFVILFNTNDATYGDQSDRWWCCAFQDHTSWTPSVTTQATTGRLVGVPGELTAAASMGAYVVAYKERGMYLGQYAGPPVAWQWDQVPGEIGCVGPEAVADIGGRHFFVGLDNVWMYDGTRPQPIATGQVRQWLFNDISATYKYRTIVHYDRQNSRVWVFYPSASSSGQPDRALVYNIITKQWGRANRSVEAVWQFITPGLTWDTLSTLSATWDGLPSIPWDSQSWQAAGRAMAYFDTSHTLYTLTGSSSASSLITGDMGDDDLVTYADPLRLRYSVTPTAANGTGYTRQYAGGALTTNSTQTMTDGKFDIRQSGRWHRYSVSFTGDVEVIGIAPAFKAAGRR
jgi:hypothetical protein